MRTTLSSLESNKALGPPPGLRQAEVTEQCMVLLFLMLPTPLQAYAIQRWEFRARAGQASSFLGGIVHVRGAFVDEAIVRSAYGELLRL